MTLQPASAPSVNSVFVTGGTGFLGAYLIKQLVEKGYRVRAMSRNDNLPYFIPSEVIEKVQWVKGDVLDVVALEEAMEGMDAVIHSAAKISFAANDRDEMLKINIDGTANVVNAALTRQIKRFIHVSSVAALGRTQHGENVDETKKWQQSRFNTAYAISKYHGEIEVWRGIAEGLPAIIVNPSTLIGYGNWDTSSCAIFKSVYKGFSWYTNGINGFTDVEDVSKAIVLLMESNMSGERFVLNGDNWSFRQLFAAIADGFGKTPPHREATPLLAAIAWRLSSLRSAFNHKKSLLTKESAAVAQSKTYFNNSKFTGCLPGFTFTPLAQSISHACKAYLENTESLHLAK